MTTPIPSNSITAFNQTNAPVGWTKLTNHNDIAIRIVPSAGGASVTNRQSFSTVFANRNIAGSFNSNYSINPAVPPGAGPHTHTITAAPSATSMGPSSTSPVQPARAWSPLGSATVSPAGGGSPHTHSATPASSGPSVWSDTDNNIDFRINYIDVIIAQRN